MYSFQESLSLTKGMEFPLGLDDKNDFRQADLSELNHLLISGASGFGKSTFLDSMILSLVAHNDPDKVRFVLCDTKMSEFSQYADMEHLLMPISTSLRDISVSLGLVLSQGQERLRTFAWNRVKSISLFNDIAWENYEHELPRIVVIVDDLSTIANPPLQTKNAYSYIAERIEQILSIGRAAGIHLVAATQTPAKKRMKTLSSLFLSKVIFYSQSPADLHLLTGSKAHGPKAEPGKALFCTGGNSEFIQVIPPKQTDFLLVARNSEADLIDRAAEIIVTAGTASEIELQKELHIDGKEVSNLLSQLEEMGLVTPVDNFGSRKALISKTQWDEAMRQIENE